MEGERKTVARAHTYKYIQDQLLCFVLIILNPTKLTEIQYYEADAH